MSDHTENRLTVDDRVAMIAAMGRAASGREPVRTLDPLQTIGARAIGCTLADLRGDERRWLFVAARCVIAGADVGLPLDVDPLHVSPAVT